MTFSVTFRKEPRSNINMSIENQRWTFYLMAVVMCVVAVKAYEMVAVEISMTLAMIFRPDLY